MNIDDIEIHIIRVKDNEKSDYYLTRTLHRCKILGHKNLHIFDAVTPENMNAHEEYNSLPDIMSKFSSHRYYTKKRKREWDPVEKAIWASHWCMWYRALKKGIIIIEHDCYLQRKLDDKILTEEIFSFCRTQKSTEIAACGYYLSPNGARRLINLTLKRRIDGPVDGYIHSIQDNRYPYGTMTRKFIKSEVYGVHFINDKIGTVKTPIKKRKYYVSKKN